MDNNVNIRKAGLEDLDTIESLAWAIWPVTYQHILTPDQLDYMMDLFYSPASLRKQMEKDTFLLLAWNDAPAGFASYSEAKEPGVFKLHKIYVQPGIQGKGLGRALLDHILADIKTCQAKALDLNVNRFNKAKYFYEKLGFSVIREEDIDIGKGYQMNDYVMRRPV